MYDFCLLENREYSLICFMNLLPQCPSFTEIGASLSCHDPVNLHIAVEVVVSKEIEVS